MAIIRREGLCSGDRLRECKLDISRLYWPWFFTAANGYARLELNYDRIMLEVFGNFSEPPLTRDEFKAIFADYYRNFLAFPYRCDGKTWVQFDTDKSNLPRHPNANDKRSPAPPAEAYAEWIAKYKTRKEVSQAVDISEFEVLHTTSIESAAKPPRNRRETAAKNRRGVGVGVGVGEGVGDGGGEKPCAAPAAPTKPAVVELPVERTPVQEADLRHAEVRDFIQKCIRHATGLPEAPWGPADGRHLKESLLANPSWNVDTYKRLVQNRFRSEGIARGDPAYKWLKDLSKYAEGPLDRFGKVMGAGNGNGTYKTEQRRDSNRKNILRGLGLDAGADAGPSLPPVRAAERGADGGDGGDDGGVQVGPPGLVLLPDRSGV